MDFKVKIVRKCFEIFNGFLEFEFQEHVVFNKSIKNFIKILKLFRNSPCNTKYQQISTISLNIQQSTTFLTIFFFKTTCK
jgi:hypothetical protein